MGFHEVQLELDPSRGASGGPGFSTQIITVDSGAEERIPRWESARRRYEISYAIQSKADLQGLIDFYIARQGTAFGFRFRDWNDFSTSPGHTGDPTPDDFEIGIGDAVETQFQLRKVYSSGGTDRPRNIQKPRAGSVRVAINGVEQLSGWSVDTTQGIVTFATPPAAGQQITAGCLFDVPVRFGEQIDSMLPMVTEAFETSSIPEVPLVEIKDPLPIQDEFFFGGSTDHGIVTAGTTLSLLNGRVQSFTPDVSGHLLSLPDFTNLPEGGPYFYLINQSGSESMTIQDSGKSIVATLDPLSMVTIILGREVGSVKRWYAA